MTRPGRRLEKYQSVLLPKNDDDDDDDDSSCPLQVVFFSVDSC